jgi:formylglycine-generating enzyme required for sulfatase activity
MPPEPEWGWRDTHPVVNVTWWEACRYSVWAGGRLPTEAEWEKAARWDPNTGGSLIYPWGDEWDAWRCNNVITGPGMTSDVWTYEEGRSPSGLWDMAGNVWEWCLDIYDDKFYARHPASGAWDNPVNGSLSDCARVLDLLDRYRQDQGLGDGWREGFDQWLEESNETNVYRRSRLLRGGSWYDDNQYYLRCAYRNFNYPLNWNDNRGFRVAVAD